jgi:hypothetical protein
MNELKSKNINSLRALNISDVKQGSMSASFIRNIVRHGLKEKFDEIYAPYLEQQIIDDLYLNIENGLKKPSPKVKKQTKRNNNSKASNNKPVNNNKPANNNRSVRKRARR